MNENHSYRVLRCVGGIFDLLAEDGSRLSCRARGNLRRGDGRVLVGDLVSLEIDENGECAIGAVAERRNSLIRPPLANLDELLVVAAVRDPLPQTDTLDKLLAILEHNGIDATVILTKCDLDPEAAERLSFIYTRAGYRVFCVSSFTGQGIAEMTEYLNARLALGAVLAVGGASGVGKSSLINRIFPALDLGTGEISRKIARGKNTTRVTELFSLSGGFLADTPGFSLLDFIRFDFMDCDDLAYAFREFVPLLPDCEYADCRHLKEERCAVRLAVGEGKVAESRYATYAALYPVLREKKRTQIK